MSHSSRRSSRISALVLSLGFALPASAATFTVNSLLDTADASPGNGICDDGSGNCTLRAALQEAAAGAGGDTITFSVSGTIATVMNLPQVTQPNTVIDGTGQTVSVVGSGSNTGFVLASTGATIRGLRVSFPAASGVNVTATGSGNTIEGLVLGGGSNGIVLAGSGTVIRGCFIGTNAAGTVADPNQRGIHVAGTGTVIGGSTPADRNIIAGNSQTGINLVGAQNTTIQGNYIGTDVTGTVAIGNGFYGIYVGGGAANSTIGGSAAGAGNVISGQGCTTCTAVLIESAGTQGNVVQGNLIGTNAAGTAAIPNGFGVVIDSAGANTVGGAGSGNVISGNLRAAVVVNFSTPGSTVQGNKIGVLSDGVTPLPNGEEGIQIGSSSGNIIGGALAGQGNVIARNVGYGIFIISGSGNSILGTPIHHNISGGIRIGAGGVPNDPCDGDTGANELQNSPVVTSAISAAGSTTIAGTLDSIGSSSYVIQLFGNEVGGQQGGTYLGSTTAVTDGSCQATWSALVPGSWNGQPITATATDAAGNTSEFSAPYTATPVELTRFSAE